LLKQPKESTTRPRVLPLGVYDKASCSAYPTVLVWAVKRPISCCNQLLSVVAIEALVNSNLRLGSPEPGTPRWGQIAARHPVSCSTLDTLRLWRENFCKSLLRRPGLFNLPAKGRNIRKHTKQVCAIVCYKAEACAPCVLNTHIPPQTAYVSIGGNTPRITLLKQVAEGTCTHPRSCRRRTRSCRRRIQY
jgi:hypothetical protein